MWTRAELKARARMVLRTSYWKAFLVSIILGFAGGQAGGASVNFGSPFSGFSGGGAGPGGTRGGGGGMSGDMGFLPILIVIIAVVVVVALLFVLAFRIFLGFPLEVGSRQYFKKAALGDANLNVLGYAFDRTKYGAIVKAMLYRGVLNFLWYLLLIVPGIVKSYAYSMVPYILTDNPRIGTRRALELSRRMTSGHKGGMWVLDLSFIGWYLLGTLALVVGLLFVMPYVNATKAELYVTLRERALERGLCSAEELGIA